MPIRYVAGDLFANDYQAQALAHGCNCQGSMGAGIAVGFREHYPAMYEEYHRRCKAKPRHLRRHRARGATWTDADNYNQHSATRDNITLKPCSLLFL